MKRAGISVPKHLAAAILALVILAVAVYLQTGGHEFSGLDDDVYVTQNAHVLEGLSWRSFIWAFTSAEGANWHPLTWLSHLADVSLFGTGPAGPHLMNALLHTLNGVLLFLALLSLTGGLAPSALVAALFLVHPIHAESVAWVAERKDVLSAFFFMLTVLFYGSYVRKPGLGRLGAVWGVFVLALLAKPMAVTLPFVLLLLDWWPLGRLLRDAKGSRRAGGPGILLEKVPLFLLSAASSVVTLHAQTQGGAVKDFAVYPLGGRVANALVAYLVYLLKTAWPARLAAFYPYPVSGWGWMATGAAAAALALTTAAVLWVHRRHPFLLTGWLWYLGMLVPVIGIVQVGDQALAYRYTYLPLIGIFVACVWGGVEAAPRRPGLGQALTMSAAALILVLTATAWREVRRWRNDVVLFSHALRVTSENWQANVHLAAALQGRGDIDGAVAYYREALRIQPNRAGIANNLGNALAAKGNVEEGMYYLRQAVRLKPNLASARYNLGDLLISQGMISEGVASLRMAVELEPANVDFRTRLGTALATQGNLAEALALLRQAVALSPASPAANNNLGNALVRAGQLDEGIGYLKEALRLNPGAAGLYWYNIGAALTGSGRLPEAFDAYERALRADPRMYQARNNLGIILVSLGRIDEAVLQYREALRVKPDYETARVNLQKALSAGAK